MIPHARASTAFFDGVGGAVEEDNDSPGRPRCDVLGWRGWLSALYSTPVTAPDNGAIRSFDDTPLGAHLDVAPKSASFALRGREARLYGRQGTHRRWHWIAPPGTHWQRETPSNALPPAADGRLRTGVRPWNCAPPAMLTTRSGQGPPVQADRCALQIPVQNCRSRSGASAASEKRSGGQLDADLTWSSTFPEDAIR